MALSKPGYISSWISGFLSFVALAGIGALLFPIFAQVKTGGRPTCLTNLKHASLVVLMYANDFDDRLPPAKTWMDKTMPYSKDKWSYRCPALQRSGPNEFGHAFRRSLGGIDVGNASNPDQEAMIFDSTDLTWNANGPLSLLPFPGRLREGKNGIAFLSGHATTLTRQQLLGLYSRFQP